MKSQWVLAGLVCCLSAQLSAENQEAAEVTQTVRASAQITAVEIEAIHISSNGVRMQRSVGAGGAIASEIRAVPTVCADVGTDIHLKKEGNPYFKEQFSALLTSHKLKQPVNLMVYDESGVCAIDIITVTR
jgi:hypothetical protein